MQQFEPKLNISTERDIRVNQDGTSEEREHILRFYGDIRLEKVVYTDYLDTYRTGFANDPDKSQEVFDELVEGIHNNVHAILAFKEAEAEHKIQKERVNADPSK